MKSAKEMFEELGYKQEENNKRYISYCWYYYEDYEDKDCMRKIVFDLQDKGFLAYSPYNLDKYKDCSIFIDLKELQAINKQVEELGWLGSNKE